MSPIFRRGLAGVLAAAFLWAVEELRTTSLAEGDLCWMIPMVRQIFEDKGPLATLRVILWPAPFKIDLPAMKAFLHLGITVLGLPASALILAGVGVHLVNTLLFWRILRLSALPARTAFLAACVHGMAFVQFHAVVWPPAIVYHLFSLTLVLAVLALYLTTERRILDGRSGRPWIAATTAMAGIASLGRGTLLLVPALLAHLFFSSGGPEERLGRYRRWLPLFLIYGVYPALFLAVVGEHHTNVLLKRVLSLLDSEASGPLHVFLVGMTAWGLGLGAVRLLLTPRLQRAWGGRRIGWRGWMAAGAAAALLLGALDRRQLLLLYNALVPMMTATGSFLDPFGTALSFDSSHPFYLIPPTISGWTLALVLGMIALFVRTLRAQRDLIVWPAWYGTSLIHFLFQFSSQPVIAPSRHYVYVAPVFAVGFSIATVWTWDALAARAGCRPALRRGTAVFLLLALCLSNAVGIRLAGWRERLTNHFYSYDGIRTARLIQEDLARRGEGGGSDERLIVLGVIPMPFDRTYWWHVRADPQRHDLFRYLFKEIAGREAAAALQVNPVPEPGSGRRVYRIKREKLLGPDGRPVDPFERLFEEGAGRLRRGEIVEARDRLIEAVRIRPFLFRFLLGKNGRLEDLRWLTGGTGMREWLRRMRFWWGASPEAVIPKHRHIAGLMEQETAQYLLTLFCLSYADQRLNNAGLSRRWLAQMRHVEPEPQALRSWLARQELVRAEPALREHLTLLDRPDAFSDPLPRRKEDYDFGRFLMRFLIGLDIRSSWDRQHDVIK